MAAVSVAQQRSAHAHVRVLTSLDVTYPERRAAEVALWRARPGDVIESLLPYMNEQPRFSLNPGIGPRNPRDERTPPRIYINQAVEGLFYYHIWGTPRISIGVVPRARPKPDLSGVLLRLLPRATGHRVRNMLARALSEEHWRVEVERVFARLTIDTKEALDVRLVAAECLLERFPERYYFVVRTIARRAVKEAADGHRWLSLLCDAGQRLGRIEPRPGSTVPVRDPVVIDLAADFIAARLPVRPHGAHGAYAVAYALQGYVGEQFTPDTSLPKYRGQDANSVFVGDTATAALAWCVRDRKERASGRNKSSGR